MVPLTHGTAGCGQLATRLVGNGEVWICFTGSSQTGCRGQFQGGSKALKQWRDYAAARGKTMEVMVMIRDDRDTLQVLKAELDFIEKGGYGRSVKTPWKPTSIFQDSLSCLNMGDPERIHPCDECLLIDFVPPEQRTEDVPCHHILLSPGETVERMERRKDRQQLEETVKNWLRAKIKQIELERAAPIDVQQAAQ